MPPLTSQAPVFAAGADTSVRMPPLTSQAPVFAAGADTSVRMPPLTSQAPAPSMTFQPDIFAHGSTQSVRLPPQAAPAASFSVDSVPQTRQPFTLATAAPMPIPPNALALEPPPVINSIRQQILAEIEAAGIRSGSSPNTSASLFNYNIPLNHPLKDLLTASLDTILQAVSMGTLQTYLTAWRSFRTFHHLHQTPLANFSLLTITSFISYLHKVKHLRISTIKGYMSGIQFFHKLMLGSPSTAITNPQTAMLLKGIEKTQPKSPDPRLPITIEILSKCLATLRKGYSSVHTARTLDAMFVLAFFGFLRCSEFTVSATFDPNLHPTISDLAIIDDEAISFFIKHSKTDQMRKGHHVYIFKIQTPIQPYQVLKAYTSYRCHQIKSSSDPLFGDEFNRPVTRFWFQKHLKQVLLTSGFPPHEFSSHSFRIGAATTAAQNGLPDSQIQTLGRWSSEAFKKLHQGRSCFHQRSPPNTHGPANGHKITPSHINPSSPSIHFPASAEASTGNSS
nr:uncharacterized protein LOC129418600 [Misgurnus anguillicaudatus]